MYPERFWQVFTAASLNPTKAEEFLQTLRPTDLDPTDLFLSWPKLTDAERHRITSTKADTITKAFADGVTILHPKDYPESLQQVPNQPRLLFAKGQVEPLNNPKVGIVGTRRATTQGKAIAQKFAEHLALAGCTIVSGGAFGIDIAAHLGALNVNKPTVCVLPCGLDRAQPPRHAEHFQRMTTNGCLISPYAIGTPTSRDSLLARNAILAALVDVLLVIEAPLPSGSLNTATHAANLNRPLYVVPGSISLDNYRGSHQLIRDGATLVDHPDQILADLNIQFDLSSQKFDELPETQALILHLLGSEAIPLESISAETGLTTQELLAELTMLELDGHVIKHSGGYART
ncbi:DNA protecting protein DprA [Armatimonadetes bacterium Uphvl-Ar1]|nr:DNA protecting protein DprA [Armatimonadetes bacterium Uphvl-Ar1]